MMTMSDPVNVAERIRDFLQTLWTSKHIDAHADDVCIRQVADTIYVCFDQVMPTGTRTPYQWSTTKNELVSGDMSVIERIECGLRGMFEDVEEDRADSGPQSTPGVRP